MRIRFFESVTIDGERYERATDHDLPNDQADALVQSGVAVKCDESRFARPATARREPDLVSTPGILASIESGTALDEPEALPKARAARAR